MTKRVRRAWGSIRRRNGKYYVRFTKADGCETSRLGGKTRGEAEDLLRDLRKEVEAGPAPGPVRLEQWVRDDYLRVLAARLTETSLGAAAAHFTKLCEYLRDHAGDPTMDRVTRAHAETFAAWMAEEGYARSYVHRLVNTVRRAWDDAATRQLVQVNPWSKLDLGRVEHREVPWISPARLVELYDAVNANQRPLIVLLGETGLRLGEALALRWSDVNLVGDAKSVHVRTGKTPSSRRTVPLSARAVAVLVPPAEPEAADELVFPPRSEQGVLRAMHRACEKIGHPVSRVHDLRHWYASHLVQAGVPPSTVARLLGHADGGALVCNLYGRWMPQDAERRALEQLTRFRATPGTPAGSRTNPARPPDQEDHSRAANAG
jgi:integrase